MHAFKGRQRANSPDTKRSPVRDFFRKHNPKTFATKMKDNARLVKRAYKLRNEDNWASASTSVKDKVIIKGETGSELSAKIKYPAAQIVADWASGVTIPLAVAALKLLTSWSETAQGVVGGIGGDYIGNVLAFAACWYTFNIKRFRREGFKAFLSETKTFVVRALVGLAIDLEKKLDEKEARGENVSKLKRWTYRIGGALLSPVPVVYYLYGAGIALGTKLGVDPILAAFLGGFGLTTTFMAYSTLINRKFLSGIDKKVRGES